ncbi:MAG: peptide deformylase [Acidobacteria bacterium]|nr:peptide deformylase [Acidobacteriota bacterium]
MQRKILLYGDPVLETNCDPVAESEFGTPELATLVSDMFETMYEAKGVGLAAPQIGELKRVFIVDTTVADDDGVSGEKRVLINPEILTTGGEQLGEEGCLSIPGFREKVRRPAKVRVRARDEKGQSFEMDGRDLMARAILHENDHLDGVLFLKHLTALKRNLIKRKIEKLRKKGEWE